MTSFTTPVIKQVHRGYFRNYSQSYIKLRAEETPSWTSPLRSTNLLQTAATTRWSSTRIWREREKTPKTCQMENTENSTGQTNPTAYTDLENILKGLHSLSNSMDQLALRTQLRQCDLIVCVGHPDKLALVKIKEPLKQHQRLPSITWNRDVMN